MRRIFIFVFLLCWATVSVRPQYNSFITAELQQQLTQYPAAAHDSLYIVAGDNWYGTYTIPGYNNALHCYEAGLQLATQQHDLNIEAEGYRGIAGVYDALGDFPEKAYHYYDTALKIETGLRDTFFMRFLVSCKASVSLQLRDSALTEKLVAEMGGLATDSMRRDKKFTEAYLLRTCYLLLRNNNITAFLKAFAKLDKAFDFSSISKNAPVKLAQCLARWYTERHLPDSAIAVYKQVLAQSPNDSAYVMARMLPLLARQGKYKEAYEYGVILDQYNQRHLKAAQLQNLTVSLLEVENELREKENKLLLSQKKAAEVNVYLALSMVILLATAALLAYNRIIYLKKKNEARIQEAYTQQLLRNTEAERNRIAADLHDGVGHNLLALKQGLHEGQNATAAKIDTIIGEIRTISHNLHPVMLDKIGLALSLEALCDQFITSEQFFVSAEIDYGGQLSREGELQLYRIVQEALTNSLKYADAHAAKILIYQVNNTLHVEIKDNGRGFDVQQKLKENTSFGLHSIIERGKTLSGKTVIQSSTDGTIIKLEIPLKNAANTDS